MYFPEKKELKIRNQNVAGIILAGGLSRRMGENKSEKKFLKKSLIEIIVQRASKQVDFLGINSNTIITHFSNSNIEIFPDSLTGNLGPLAGVLSAIKWARKKKEIEWIITFPVDCPFFPETLVSKLLKHSKNVDIVIAASNYRKHSVFSLWKANIENHLEKQILSGVRKIDDFTKKLKTRVVNFSVIGYDPFFNINNTDDFKIAKEIYIRNFSEIEKK